VCSPRGTLIVSQCIRDFGVDNPRSRPNPRRSRGSTEKLSGWPHVGRSRSVSYVHSPQPRRARWPRPNNDKYEFVRSGAHERWPHLNASIHLVGGSWEAKHAISAIAFVVHEQSGGGPTVEPRIALSWRGGDRRVLIEAARRAHPRQTLHPHVAPTKRADAATLGGGWFVVCSSGVGSCRALAHKLGNRPERCPARLVHHHSRDVADRATAMAVRRREDGRGLPSCHAPTMQPPGDAADRLRER